MYGSQILIVGPTNAGKSSLFNFILQKNQMIVSSQKGTTTDHQNNPWRFLDKK